MKPLKLTMQAFGSYSKETTIDFTKPEQNLFLITGDTGSGKSTIFDAIVFALYGKSSCESSEKESIQMQSHYTDIQSFVELEFSEKKGTEELIYHIRREPKQFKTNQKTKRTNKNSTSESVVLTMPDGNVLEHLDDTDAKIVEIVGLEKGQFMQISMIAQGEFAEFLKSSSSEKKEIFRTLFNTKIYDDIVEKLKEYKKEKKTAMDNADADYRRDAKHIRIPDDCQNMSELREKFISGNGTAESFVSAFEIFNGEMKNRKTFAETKFKEISEKHKITEKSYDTAENLITIFNKLENQKKEIPQLENKCKMLSEKEQHERREKDIAIEKFAKTEAEVNANIEKLSALSRIKKEIVNKNQAIQNFESLIKIIEKDIKKCEENISGYEKIIDENSGAEKLFYEWQNKKSVCESAVDTYMKINGQKKNTETARQNYLNASREYEIKKQEYDAKHRAFMDLQAGIIARDELHDNMPCPVCGSLDHPSPCRLPEKYDNLDSKAIDNLKKEVGKLEQNMQKQSENAHTQNELLKKITEDFNEKAEKFREVMPEIPEFENIENAGKILFEQKADIDKKCSILQKNAQKYNGAVNALNNEKNKKEKLNNSLTDEKIKLEKIKSDIENLIAKQNEIDEKNLPYTDEISAVNALRDAENLKNRKTEIYENTSRNLKEAESVIAVALDRIQNYEKEISGKERPDIETLRNAKIQADKALDDASKNLNYYDNICKNNNEIFKSLKKQAENFEKISIDYEKYNALCSRITPNKNNNNTGLETWIQQYYLRKILDSANEHLSKMSAGEFELCFDENNGGGEQGLTLFVYSGITGKTRHTNMLSGGETFITALALALGMSEQIQKTTAVVNPDIMFIDEGFGSLDEHSRNQAVNVLKEMAEGNRLIGIISHVTEMKQEIDSQLVVTKDNNGSHAEWND